MDGKRMSPYMWIARLLQGALIGGGAILPGVSGGVLCVSFGVYRPMMELLAHPLKMLPKLWRMFLPIGVGWLLGFLVFAKLIELIFHASEQLTISLFIGLIGGTVPSLFQEAGSRGRARGSFLALGLAFFLLFSLMLAVEHGVGAQVTPSLGWFFFCGLLWGLSVVVPGLTSSSILINLGLFKPMASGVASLDMGVIIPMLLGVVLALLVSARFVNSLFQRYWSLAYHAIIGVVLASTVVIIPTRFDGWGQGLAALGCAALGFAVAWAMDYFGKKLDK